MGREQCACRASCVGAGFSWKCCTASGGKSALPLAGAPLIIIVFGGLLDGLLSSTSLLGFVSRSSFGVLCCVILMPPAFTAGGCPPFSLHSSEPLDILVVLASIRASVEFPSQYAATATRTDPLCSPIRCGDSGIRDSPDAFVCVALPNARRGNGYHTHAVYAPLAVPRL